MKIAIVGLLHHPIAEPFAGGMESHTWWLAKKLQQRGHNVTLFASGDSDQSLGLQPCIEASFEANPKAKTLTGRQVCNTTAYAKVISHICRGGFDVIHNNALHPFLLTNAADLPTPMLAVLHTPVYEELAAAVQYASARNTLGRLATVCVSQSLAKAWRAFTPTSVVYNGIDVDSWPFSTECPAGDALWYGRMVPEKAPHLAIQAALKAGLKIEIAGPISDQTYFDNNIAALVDGQRVRYLGHLPQSDLRQALSRARVFLNTPVWEEPYGFVYAEALASGTPVATFDSGAAREILTDDCGAIAHERTVNALADAVQTALGLSRRACRERAQSFCHIDSMIEGYELLYQQLIERQQRASRRRPQHTVLPQPILSKVSLGVENIQSLVGITA